MQRLPLQALLPTLTDKTALADFRSEIESRVEELNDEDANLELEMLKVALNWIDKFDV